MSAELDEVLTRLQGMGSLDSQGAFSLDSSRARLLLEKYRLPAATYFMLHAVGAAVCSRATRVQVSLRSDRFEVLFDGEPFLAEDVDHCFASLWSQERSHSVMRLRELAIARGGAEGWGAREFSLGRSPTGLQRIRVLKRGLGSKLRLTLGWLGRREEEDLLRQHLVPTLDCQLSLNGKPIQALAFPHQVERAAEWQAREMLDELKITSQTPLQPDWLDDEQQAWLSSARGVICRLPASDRSPSTLRAYWPGYLDLILNGRLYRCPLPQPLSRCWAIFWLSGVRRDLSHTFIAAEDLAVFVRLISEFNQ